MFTHDISWWRAQARLWQVGRLMPQRLARHLEAHCAIPVLYASSWLLTAFAADFPIFFASRIMDVVLTDRYLEPIMKARAPASLHCLYREPGGASTSPSAGRRWWWASWRAARSGCWAWPTWSAWSTSCAARSRAGPTTACR